MKPPFSPRWLPALLWMALIFLGSTDFLAGNHTSLIVEPLLRWLFHGISQARVEEIHHLIRKAGHVTEYAVLAILFCWPLRPWLTDAREPRRFATTPTRTLVLALVLTAAYAASDEFHQSFVPSRGASVRDVFIDTCGACVGLLVLWSWRKFRGGKQRTRTPGAIPSQPMNRLLLFAAIAGCLATRGFAADPTPEPAPAKDKDKPAESTRAAGDKDRDRDQEPPPPVVTDHTITLSGGRVLKYKATAGYLTLRDTAEPHDSQPKPGPDKEPPVSPLKGKSKAQIFFVAYTLDPTPDVAARPLTFSFNGGPGSSSVWLHMGALGPRRAQLTDEGEAPPPPYKLVDNESTWLDQTDLVFIDPVSTGYSRAAGGEGSNQFHGYKEDIASVGEFIRLYLSHNARWSSPKFIVGESYGTTRAAGLSDYLQEKHGIYLNGIVLLSSVLDFQTLEFAPGNNLPYSLYLPGYTAAAWYHQRLPADLQSQPLAGVLKLSEQFASHDYLIALSQGSALPPDERARIADGLARFTGLPAAQFAQQNLREDDGQFFTDLLKDKNRSIGRFDARYTGIRYNPGTSDRDFDPSYEAVYGPFTSGFNDYVRRELKYETDLPYNMLTSVAPWNFSNAENSYLDVAENLRQAMSRHPYLKVMVGCGYYDLATPYFAARHVVEQMQLDPAIRGNLTLAYYDAGHMIYVRKTEREKFRADFEGFVNSALHAPPQKTAER